MRSEYISNTLCKQSLYKRAGMGVEKMRLLSVFLPESRYSLILYSVYSVMILPSNSVEISFFFHSDYKMLSLHHERHHGRDGVSNHRCLDCLHKRLFRCRSKKQTKFRVTGLCEGNSPVTGEFPAQKASNSEIVSIWLRHHGTVW